MTTSVITTKEQATPWMQTKETRQPDQAPSKNVEWYQPELRKLPASTVEFFQQYVGLKTEDEVRDHVLAVRDKAWRVLPYPCIGLFRFLDFSIHLSPSYAQVVERVQAGQTLLDVGCCVGQDLRKLAFDAGASVTLVGVDLEESFLQLGYELFRDADRFKGYFHAESIFEDDFLMKYRGKVDMIYLGSFLHLFKVEQQRAIIRTLSRTLSDKPGSMIFGRNLGASQGGEFHMKSLGWDLYRHSQETIRDLFEQEQHGDSLWSVESSLSRYGSASWDDDRRSWQGNDTKQMMFTATKL